MSEGEVIGREFRVVKRELSDEERDDRKHRLERAHDRKREIEGEFNAFKRWAEPRIKRATDPSYKAPKELEDEPPLSIEEAYGLRVELIHRRGLKVSSVQAVKSEIALLEHTAAVGVEYARIECELVKSATGLEIIYQSHETGQEVYRRAARSVERQEQIPGTNPPKKGRKKKGSAPDAVV